MKALAVVLVVLCVVLAACGAGNDESDIDELRDRVAELELRLDLLLRELADRWPSELLWQNDGGEARWVSND